jgi:hypothetical protein
MDHHHQPTNQKHHLLYFPLVIKRELVYAISFLIVVASSFFVFDLLGSFDPRSVFRFSFTKNDKDSSHSACDYSRGRWVRDESYKNLSYTENCPFLDPGFRCVQNGRKDVDYRNWRWQPEGCDLPRYGSLYHESLASLVMHAWMLLSILDFLY